MSFFLIPRRLVGSHHLLPFSNVVSLSSQRCVCVQSCLTLCDSLDCSPPDSSVHGIFQARVLEWIAISFSRGSSQPRNRTRVSCSVSPGNEIKWYWVFWIYLSGGNRIPPFMVWIFRHGCWNIFPYLLFSSVLLPLQANLYKLSKDFDISSTNKPEIIDIIESTPIFLF